MAVIVVYDSFTGKSKEFAKSLGFPYVDIKDYKEDENSIYLLTRSFKIGETSPISDNFLKKYKDKVIGMSVSANRNWGIHYGAGGRKLSEEYNIPLISIYEASGLPDDREFVKQWITSWLEKKEEKGNA